MIHRLYVTPDTVFYLRVVLLAISTVWFAIRWNRWTIKRMIKAEFIRQLWLIHFGVVPVKPPEREG